MRKRTGLGLLAIASFVVACTRARVEGAPFAVDDDEAIVAPGFVTPLPPRAPVDPAKRALGKRLFRDPALSGDGRVACSTCHVSELGYADGNPRSIPAGRPPSPVNAPTILNVASYFAFNWSGRFSTLEEHHDALITNPIVMATTWDDVVTRLRRDGSYASAFAASYPEGITPRSVRDALITYERSLVTPDARFDRFLRGETEALDGFERRGWALFRSYGCISCHQGKNVGGNMFQRLGTLRDYFADRGNLTDADLGRYNVTKRPEDKYVFRVPSLRNVALTAPYLHDGSAATLEDAIGIMARYQLGRSLQKGDAEAIAAFLRTLTGRTEDEP